MPVRPKGPMPEDWRPSTAVGRALMADILARLQQHQRDDTLPRSPRGLFYDLRPHGMGNGLTYVKQPRMEPVPGTASKRRRVDPTEIAPVHVQEMLANLRRAGIVPERWIEDTRAPDPNVPYYNEETAETEAEYLADQVRQPRITYSPQRGQAVFLELVVEAAGLMGRCTRIAGGYGVPVYSGGGFDGLKGKRAFAERAADRDVRTVVLRISDFDPHGLMIAETSAADSIAWAVNHHGLDEDWLEFERIGLTEEQAEVAGLLDEEGKAEADGLPVPVMDQLIIDAITAYQDPDIAAANEREAAEESARVTGLVLALLGQDS